MGKVFIWVTNYICSGFSNPKRENDLVAATFGRGFYVLDDYSSLRFLSASSLKII